MADQRRSELYLVLIITLCGRAANGQLLDDWSVREKLVLACSVIRSGDQNWASVSRTIKPICEAVTQRPADWFAQRNCANQYADLLEGTSTKKRKRTTSTSDSGAANETPQEQILRRLTFERVDELKKSIDADREKYKKLKSDIEKIRSGKLDDQLARIWGDIQNIQSGTRRIPIEQLIQETKPEQMVMGGFGSSSLSSSATAAQQQQQLSNIHRANRSQRVPKTTKKFETWMSQLKQQQARHEKQHQQQNPGAPQSNMPERSTSSIEPATFPGRLPDTPQSTESNTVSSQPTTPSSVAMQRQTPKQVTQPVTSVLSLTPRRLTIDTPQLMSTSNVESTSKPSPVLSSLLAAPPSEIKAVVEKQSNRDQNTKQAAVTYADKPSTVVSTVSATKESISYKPTPPSSSGPVSATAPTLSKLLESVPSVSSPPRDSNKGGTKIQTPTVTEGLESIRIKIPIAKDTTNLTPCVQKQSGGTPVKVSTSASLLKAASLQWGTRTQPVTKPPTHKAATFAEESAVKPPDQIPPSAASTTPEAPPPKKKAVELPKVLPLQPYKQTSILDEEPLPDTKPKEDQRPTTIIIPDNNDFMVTPSPRGRSRKSRGRYGRSNRRKGQPQQLLLKSLEQLQSQQQTDDDTASIDDMASERDETESEIASVSDTKDLPDIEQIEEDSRGMDEDDDIKIIEGGEAHILHKRGGRGKGATALPVVSSAAVSPSSPALSTGSNYDVETAQAQKNWRKSIMLVWKAVASHKYATVFMHPVTDDEAPGYHNIVYRPMDLSTIKKNIENGKIRTSTEFQRDMMLMFQNALMYNRADHDVYRMAEEMREEVMEQIETFIATQLHMIVQSTEKETLPMLRGHRSNGHCMKYKMMMNQQVPVELQPTNQVIPVQKLSNESYGLDVSEDITPNKHRNFSFLPLTEEEMEKVKL